MEKTIKEQWESLERSEAMYNDYWLALNNNTEEEKEYNRMMKERLDAKRKELENLK
jgi:hypothetical protein